MAVNIMRMEDAPLPHKSLFCCTLNLFLLFDLLLPGPKLNTPSYTPGKTAFLVSVPVILDFSFYKTSSVIPFKLSSISSPKGSVESPWRRSQRVYSWNRKAIAIVGQTHQVLHGTTAQPKAVAWSQVAAAKGVL